MSESRHFRAQGNPGRRGEASGAPDHERAERDEQELATYVEAIFRLEDHLAGYLDRYQGSSMPSPVRIERLQGSVMVRSSCPGYSHWYCDNWDDCTDTSCECFGE